MIRNLLKPLLRLFVLIFVLIASIVLFVKSPADHRLDIYHLHDCELPCWVGIIPGKTTLSETLKLLTNSYPISQYADQFGYDAYDGTNFIAVTRRSDSLGLFITFNADEGAESQTSETIVSQISLSAYSPNQADDQETLFDWMLEFGSLPQALSITWGNFQAFPNVLYTSKARA